MYSISLFAAALCMAFLYRAQHPARVLARAGLNPENREVSRQPVMRFAARVRLATGLAVMLLLVVATYRLPVEIGHMLTAAQDRQVELQTERLAGRFETERRHVDQMIATFGSRERYLTYLALNQERQFIQK